MPTDEFSVKQLAAWNSSSSAKLNPGAFLSVNLTACSTWSTASLCSPSNSRWDKQWQLFAGFVWRHGADCASGCFATAWLPCLLLGVWLGSIVLTSSCLMAAKAFGPFLWTAPIGFHLVNTQQKPLALPSTP